MFKDELLEKFGDLEILNQTDRNNLIMVAGYGPVFFKNLMKVWKDNHADSAVRQRAATAFDSL